jgi:hypothetical protein
MRISTAAVHQIRKASSAFHQEFVGALTYHASKSESIANPFFQVATGTGSIRGLMKNWPALWPRSDRSQRQGVEPARLTQ